MNIIYPAIGLVGSILGICLIWEFHRRHSRRREFRNSCPECGSSNTTRRHLRVKIRADLMNPVVLQFFQKADFICQTQKKCLNKDCPKYDKFLEEKTLLKFFNPIRQIFRPSHCKENAKPEELVGYWKAHLIKKETKAREIFKPESLASVQPESHHHRK